MKYSAIRRLIALATCFLLCSSYGSADAQDTSTEQIILGTKYTIHSDILGDDRSFIVTLPEGYESVKLSYLVLYILDAEYFYYQAYGALQFLSECGYNSNRPVPQMILVAVLDNATATVTSHRHTPQYRDHSAIPPAVEQPRT